MASSPSLILNDRPDPRPPVREWAPLNEAADRFNLSREWVDSMRARGVVRSRLGDETAIDDIEELLSRQVEHSIVGGRLTYGDLAQEYGIKRGWLDKKVLEKVVQPADELNTFDVTQVIKALNSDPDQKQVGQAWPTATMHGTVSYPKRKR